MARLCYDGAKHQCFGPWYVCAIFGCAADNPRPTKEQQERDRLREQSLEADKAMIRLRAALDGGK